MCSSLTAHTHTQSPRKRSSNYNQKRKTKLFYDFSFSTKIALISHRRITNSSSRMPSRGMKSYICFTFFSLIFFCVFLVCFKIVTATIFPLQRFSSSHRIESSVLCNFFFLFLCDLGSNPPIRHHMERQETQASYFYLFVCIYLFSVSFFFFMP